MIDVLRDNGLSPLLPEEATLELLADGLDFTEGPLELADGSLLFQDIKATKTYRIAGPGAKAEVLRDATEAANGQTFGPDGLVYFCEQDGRRFSRMRPDGTGYEVVVEEYQGKRLNSPNDVVAHSSGTLVFTDPPYGVKPSDKALPFQGVFAYDRSGGLTLLVDDFAKPNGLAFSPDEKTLYICDTANYHVRAFDVVPHASAGLALVAGSGRVFAKQDPGPPGGPDGLKVDREGRVYVAVAEGIWVYGPDGTLLGILGMPGRPSNLNWRGRDGSTLAITSGDKVYQIRTKVSGLTPIFLPHG